MKAPPRGRSRPTPGLSKDALRVRKPRVTDLFENDAVFLCTHDLEGKLLTINDASCRALGYSEAELVGRSVRDVLAPDYRGEFDGYLARLRGSGAATGVMTVAARGGEKRYWHYQNVVRSEGGSSGVVHGTAIDVTDVIRVEQSASRALDQRTAYLRAILEHSPLAILAHDADRRIQLVNPAFERLFQYEESELVGRDIDDVIAPDGENAELKANSAQLIAGSVIHKTGRRRRKNGTLVDVEIFGVPLFDEGRLTGACGIYRDLSAEKRAEDELRRQALIFENLHDAVIIVGQDEKIRDSNSAAESLFGYRREEIRGRHFSLLFGDEGTDLKEIRREALERGRWSGESEFRRKDGTNGIRHLVVLPLRGPSGEVLGTAGISRDVTEERRAGALQSALYRITAAASSIDDMGDFYAAIHEIVGGLLDARNFYIAIYDPREDLITFPYFVDTAGDSPKPMHPGKSLTSIVLQTGEPLYVTNDSFDEMVARGEANLVGQDSADWLGVPLVAGGKTIGVLAVQSYTPTKRSVESEMALLTFVSQHVAAAIEHKRSTNALRASEERYRLLFERNLAGMYRSLRDGTLLDCNDAFAKILGYSSRSEVLEQNARSLYFFESDRAAILDEVEKTGTFSGREVCLRRRDGTPVWVYDNMNLVPSTEGASEFLEGSLIDISERRMAEEAVRDSEKRYRFLFDANPLPMWVYELETLRFLDVNEAAVEHYGYSRAEFLQMHLPDLWPPEDRDLHSIAPSAPTPQTFTTSRHLRKDGTIRHVEVSAVDLPGGPAPRRMALGRDVTEQKLAEEALLESETNFRNIFDNSPVGIYQVASDGKFLTVNPAFARMLGYTLEELIANVSADDLYFERREREKYIQEHLASPRAFETTERRLKTKNGDPAWIQVTSRIIRGEAKEVVRFEGFTYDITEKKRADEQQARLQAAVLETARQWRDTFDAIDTPVLVVDGDAVVKRLNLAAVKLAEQSYVNVLGKRIDDLGGAACWKMAAELVRNPEAEGPRSGVLCHDEEARKVWEISVSGYRSPDSKGPPMSIVILRDITSIVRLQESVLRAESMSSMGSLVAGVAHEVRNPLFAISATLDAFDARFRERDDYKKYAQALRAQLDRMSNLMRDLLDYGRPAVLELREVPPGELVRDAARGCADLASRNGIAVEIEAPENLPAIRVDRSRTVQVFVNLVENAVQHSPENATVVVRAEACARAGSRGIRFTVEDSGPGFQASDIPKLFDPFFTKRQGGTGLGLAIVRKIVEEHGGTISPANRENGGAIVSVWLPCDPPDAGESERKA